MKHSLQTIVCVLVLVQGLACRPAAANVPRAETHAGRSGAPSVTGGGASERGHRVADTDGQPTASDTTASLKEALAAEQRGDVAGALSQYSGLLGRLLPAHERAYVDLRARALIGRLTAAQVKAALTKAGAGTRVRGLLLGRQAALLIAAGKEKQARKLIAGAGGLTAGERRRAAAEAGDPQRIGALVPLSGPLRALGQSLLQGMLMAAGLTGRAHGSGAVVVARDSARNPAAAAGALADAGVVAAVGVPRSGNARKAAPVCQKRGLPLLTGADGRGVPQLGRGILRVVHSPVQRARALAQYLAATGKITRVAVAHPGNGYGKRVAAAFAAAASKARLVVVATVVYKRSETTLYKRFQPLASKSPQAVFVADSASRLEIIAPQLALAGLQPAPLAQVGRKKGRVLLLSTAEGLSSRLVRNVGVSVQGAVLAPGFYPDLTDPALGSFVKAYQRAFGRAPGRYAALGYLAVQRIRILLLSRATGRVSLLRALLATRSKKRPALFDKNGERTDAPRLYLVHQSGIKRITTPRTP